MSERARLPVVLLWHMHQPQYRDALSGQYVLPWTYLHAIKDYVDMAAHLEAAPAARAVVNFTPVLIEQLEEIGARIAQQLFRRGMVSCCDPNARRHGHASLLARSELERWLECLEQPLGDQLGPDLQRELLGHHHELVST